jgi:hypothetical protein
VRSPARAGPRSRARPARGAREARAARARRVARGALRGTTRCRGGGGATARRAACRRTSGKSRRRPSPRPGTSGTRRRASGTRARRCGVLVRTIVDGAVGVIGERALLAADVDERTSLARGECHRESLPRFATPCLPPSRSGRRSRRDRPCRSACPRRGVAPRRSSAPERIPAGRSRVRRRRRRRPEDGRHHREARSLGLGGERARDGLAVGDGERTPQIAQWTTPPCAQGVRARRAPRGSQTRARCCRAAPALLERDRGWDTLTRSTAGRGSTSRPPSGGTGAAFLRERAERERALARALTPHTTTRRSRGRSTSTPPQVVLARALDPDAFLHRAVPIAPLGPEWRRPNTNRAHLGA